MTTVYPNSLETGRGIFVRSRLQHLAAAAMVKVVSPIWAAERSLPARWTDDRIEVYHPRWMYLPGTGAVTAILLALQLLGPLYRLRKDFAFQVLDAHFGYPEGIAAAFLSLVFRVPFTVTLRGSEMMHSKYPLRKVLIGWALRRAKRVFAVSEQLRQFAVALGTDPAKTRTISNGIDPATFYPRDRATARWKRGLPLQDYIVFSAGHLIELKGHHHAIRAIKRLVDEGISVKLLIAGGHPGRGVRSYEPEIRRLIADLKLEENVRLLGYLEHEALIEYLSAADVFCLASSREGWPNAVHEALACGVPVVATRVGAIPDLLARESYGFIVPPNDSVALANALSRALAGSWDRAEISASARSRSWDQVAGELLEELTQVVEEARLQAGR